jgi:spore germination protein
MIHVVRRGDTLWSLGRRYGVDWTELAYVNQLRNPNQLVVGQTLLIPSRDRQMISDLERGGFVYPFVSPWVLRQTLPYVNWLAVFTYGFTPQGDLLPPKWPDRWIVAMARAAGVRPVMVLAPEDENGSFSNLLASQVFNDPAARARLIGQIVETMTQQGYGELNIDFEFVLREDRDVFVTFTQEAAAAVRAAGLRSSVDLAPKTSRDQRGLLYESHDYAALAQPVDRVLLMAYEWGYKYGPPQAVAPLNQVRRVVEYALTEIPAEKIWLGMPNYGYDWPLPYQRGETVARTIGNVEAVTIAWDNRAEIFYDETAQSPNFVYTRNGIVHRVWFEDLRSWQAKLNLVREYGLAGVGVWQLNQLWRAGLQLLATS